MKAFGKLWRDIGFWVWGIPVDVMRIGLYRTWTDATCMEFPRARCIVSSVASMDLPGGFGCTTCDCLLASSSASARTGDVLLLICAVENQHGKIPNVRSFDGSTVGLAFKTRSAVTCWGTRKPSQTLLSL